uniref:Uncharacterized protein n=1 Tax=Knipowitschia caucasica TaxID=637954 RepID=A0AAV2J004_KNICA
MATLRLRAQPQHGGAAASGWTLTASCSHITKRPQMPQNTAAAETDRPKYGHRPLGIARYGRRPVQPCALASLSLDYKFEVMHTTELSLRVAQVEQIIQQQQDMSTSQQQEVQTAVAQTESLSDKLQSEEQRRTLLEEKIEELSLTLTSSQETSSTLMQEKNFLQQTMDNMMEQQRQEKLLQKKNNKRGWFLCGSQGSSSQ